SAMPRRRRRAPLLAWRQTLRRCGTSWRQRSHRNAIIVPTACKNFAPPLLVKSRRFAPIALINSVLHAYENGEQDHHHDDRKDAQYERHRQLSGQAVGLLLGARHALVAHIVAVDAQRLGQARAELLRLLEECCE